MNFLFIAPRMHTNMIPIIKKMIELENKVMFYSYFTIESENHEVLNPTVIKPSVINYIVDKFTKNKSISISNRLFFPSIAKLYRNIKKYNPDTVILRDYTITSFIVITICRLINTSNIVLYNQSPLYIENMKTLKRIKCFLITLLFPVKRITVVEFKNYNSYLKRSSLHKDKNSYFIPFAFQAESKLIKNRLYFKNNKVNILDVGKYREYKNHEVLVNAVGLMSENYRQRINITIVGQCFDEKERVYFDNLRQLIEIKGLQTNFNLVTNAQYTSMVQLYLDNDVFVLTSKQELASISIIEAMAHGLATISTHANGTASYISKGIDGEIFNSNEPQDLMKIICKFIDDTNLVLNYGNNALEKAQKIYTPLNFIKTLEKIIC